MASTVAAAAIGLSSFSPSIQTLNRIRSKNLAFDNCFLKIPTIRLIPSQSLSSSVHKRFSVGEIAQRWRVLKVSADVAQEVAAVEEEEKGAEEVKEEAVTTKLYFGNIPYNMESAELAGLIQDYGSPELVEVIYDRQTGKSKGFGFVTMSSIEDCNAVIENLDGSMHYGRPLRVNFADKPKPKEPLYPETKHKLFVGNLPFSMTSESLNKIFQDCGNVVGARIVYDGQTGRSRGFGFVCYSTESEMETAIQTLNGLEIDGRAIRVIVALERCS